MLLRRLVIVLIVLVLITGVPRLVGYARKLAHERRNTPGPTATPEQLATMLSPRLPSYHRDVAPLGGLDEAQLRQSARSANLVIVLMDAARADHFGCYGYPRQTTPNVDWLAAESVVFENYFSVFPQTKPSTTSLFTGLYPSTHLVTHNSVEVPAGLPSLAGALKAAGFRTAMLTSSAVASPRLGIGAGFDTVLQSFPQPDTRKGLEEPGVTDWKGNEQTPEALVGEFERWLASEHSGRFFAYVHFLPPHVPYRAPREVKRLFTDAWEWGEVPSPQVEQSAPIDPADARAWINSYDANLRWSDWGVGEIVRLLSERQMLDDTLLIVLADHGEAFGEHGYTFHTKGVYDELVHAPLVMRLPGRPGLAGRVSGLAQTVDLFPTLCDLFGIGIPKGVQGTSLLPLLTNRTQQVRDYAYATCFGSPASYLVRDQRYALILYGSGTRRALYDLREDPGQTKNLIDRDPARAQKLEAAFRRFASTQRQRPLTLVDDRRAPTEPQSPRLKLSDETKRQLRALGYVE